MRGALHIRDCLVIRVKEHCLAKAAKQEPVGVVRVLMNKYVHHLYVSVVYLLFVQVLYCDCNLKENLARHVFYHVAYLDDIAQEIC